MRRFRSLVRSAALEALAEPLSAVLFLVALLTIPLLPAFHSLAAFTAFSSSPSMPSSSRK